MRVLVLEDDRNRMRIFRQNFIGHILEIVTNAKPCIEKLQNEGPWDCIFLDHDLNGQIYVPSGPDTGWEVAQWLKDNPDKKPEIIRIHSMNDKGGVAKMLELLPEAIWNPGMCGFTY
jgi:CheY-like chemotaxis protein